MAGREPGDHFVAAARDDGYGARDVPGGFVFLNYVSKSLRFAWGLLWFRARTPLHNGAPKSGVDDEQELSVLDFLTL